MRFLTQDLRSGELCIVDGPDPLPGSRTIVVRTVASLVSAGTERMLVDFARANLLEKARQQPERLRELTDKARAEGMGPTLDAVRSKLAQPLALGYASSGVVTAVGDGVRGIAIGELVATNAGHAEVVTVPATFAARVPTGVDPEAACFASVAAVGLQGVRLADPTIGERFVVTGLGLIGLLVVQLLLAQGCEVLGVDPDPARRALADSFGARSTSPGDAAEAAADTFSRGRGVDGVIVCASTRSSDPIREAARMSRQRGRIVLVGVTGLELERSELYEKELRLQVSASYGPGRYEPGYEAGVDYPIGLVRWTAGRNMEAVLDLLAARKIDVGALRTHTFAFEDARLAYDALLEDASALGIVLRYGGPSGADAPPVAIARRQLRAPSHVPQLGGIAVVGAGSYATRTLIPAIRAAGRDIQFVVARSGVSAGMGAQVADAAGTTDLGAVLADDTIASIFVATRHDSHAELARRILQAGKAAYIEKPLALTDAQLDELIETLDRMTAEGRTAPILTVGFNRRFAPITVRMRALLATLSAPKAVVMTVNAGRIPNDHWTQDPGVGGGRILGEGCHFVDLARHLVGAEIDGVSTNFLGDASGDTATVSLTFADGSIADVHYLANGSPRFPKERVEVFCQGRVLVNDNFRALRTFGFPRSGRRWSRRQDKGHAAAVGTFLSAVAGGGHAPIPLEEIVEVSRATIRASRARW